MTKGTLNSTDRDRELDQQIEATAQYFAKVYAVTITEMADWIWAGRPQGHPIGQLDVK